MKKWEYKVESTWKDKTVNLDELGKEGWELVSVVTLNKEDGYQNYKFFFKRRK